MTIWSTLARLLGIRDDQVEDALASEQCARATLSRRGLLVGSVSAAMLATGKRYSFWEPPRVRWREYKYNKWYSGVAVYLNGSKLPVFEHRVVTTAVGPPQTLEFTVEGVLMSGDIVEVRSHDQGQATEAKAQIHGSSSHHDLGPHRGRGFERGGSERPSDGTRYDDPMSSMRE